MVFRCSRRAFFSAIAVSLFFLAPPMPAHALSPLDAVSKAVLSHPEVQAKWHALQAAAEEVNAAKGGFRPQLDLAAGIGRENLDGAGYEGRDLMDYTRDGVTLSLNQVLYDGNLTANQVARFGHTRKMRYFDLLAVMEKTGLEAVRSHEDVIRYRVLAGLARDNLVRHEEVMKKIEDRAKAGVESQVNLETTRGRLALARTNLITEQSNLHDAETQYVRVVGEAPADSLENAAVNPPLPSSPEKALEEALSRNPQVFASIESALVMRSATAEQKARMQPRLDFRAAANFENDVDGSEGRRDKTVVELLFRYNLYNGGSDRATLRRYGELAMESEENLKKTERDIRQAVLVAFNDIQAIGKQLPELELHMKSADSMRKAYAQQFEVGKRSLLDLLDAENEYFQASRAFSNAHFNLVDARARYLAAGGRLLEYFKVSRKDVPAPETLGVKPETYKPWTTGRK